MKKFKISVSQLSQRTTPPYPNDRHYLTANSLTHCTNSSVQFKPRSSLSKSSQQTATGYSQYTVCYIPYFNAINSTTVQFHCHMQVSFSNCSTAEFSPRYVQRLYLYFLAFFISLQVRNATNVQGTLSCVYVFFSS